MSTAFMNQDFLLSTPIARTLYHTHAKPMPIIDYHCHINPKQIAEDHVFADLTEAWLGGDHYKWRAMRANGIAERFITGDAQPFEKFLAWASTLPGLIGNPLYHWTHLELQRYFGIYEPLTPQTCQSIWERANQQLSGLSVREIIRRSKVTALCTTDDPADDLRWHQLLKRDPGSPCLVLPAFRPDKALNIDKPGFADYLTQLGKAADLRIDSLDSLKTALANRLQFFVKNGCKAADHGLDYMMCENDGDADAIFKKALGAEAVSLKEAEAFKTHLLCFLAQRYREHGIVMQLHFGAVRNNNPTAFYTLGPDTGFDAIWGAPNTGARLGALLGLMESQGGLPKTILYSLNPTDNAQIAAMIGCFQTAEHKGKIQHGSAWWFNDSKTGMTEQITNLANHTVLAHFIGMLTDSRSFLSYTRHEYFRRILCDTLGQWVEQGEYPRDMAYLGQVVADISYHNAVRYLGLETALNNQEGHE